MPWVGVSGAFGVFRGTNTTSVGAPWQMVGACAPGLVTFGPISAVVQPDGVLTMGTAALEFSFYSVWTTDIDTLNVEEVPHRTDITRVLCCFCPRVIRVSVGNSLQPAVGA